MGTLSKIFSMSLPRKSCFRKPTSSKQKTQVRWTARVVVRRDLFCPLRCKHWSRDTTEPIKDKDEMVKMAAKRDYRPKNLVVPKSWFAFGEKTLRKSIPIEQRRNILSMVFKL